MLPLCNSASVQYCDPYAGRNWSNFDQQNYITYREGGVFVFVIVQDNQCIQYTHTKLTTDAFHITVYLVIDFIYEQQQQQPKKHTISKAIHSFHGEDLSFRRSMCVCRWKLAQCILTIFAASHKYTIYDEQRLLFRCAQTAPSARASERENERARSRSRTNTNIMKVSLLSFYAVHSRGTLYEGAVWAVNFGCVFSGFTLSLGILLCTSRTHHIAASIPVEDIWKNKAM